MKIKSKNRGVTMIEVLVSISIFAIITSVVLYNHSAFNSSVAVTNLAYEVALTVKQAQSYGLSVKREAGYSGSYGAYFSTSPGDDKKVIVFADKDSDNEYDYTNEATCGSNPASECREELNIRGDVSVKNLADSYNPTGNTGELSIIFKRPDPIAYIYDTDQNNARTYGEITISSARGKEKIIRVDRSGQISVK